MDQSSSSALPKPETKTLSLPTKFTYGVGELAAAIRMIIGLLPTLILLCGLVFSYFYPITREVHVQILHQLWERNHQS